MSLKTWAANEVLTASDLNGNFAQCLVTDAARTVTVQQTFFAGTVGAPGISFVDDADTGFYRIGANNIGVAVNGTKVVDIGAAATAFNNNYALQLRAAGGTARHFASMSTGDIIVLAGDGHAITMGGALAVGGAAGGALTMNGHVDGNAPTLQTAGAAGANVLRIRGGNGGVALRNNADSATLLQTNDTGVGFNGSAPIAKPTGVAVSAAGIHAALVSYGLIAA